MGKAWSRDPLEKVTDRAEDEVGRIATFGRYHRGPRNLEDDYDIPNAKPLGSGYNGDVILARSKNTNAKFAIKAFKLHGVSREKKKDLVTEAEIFLSMDHPHVARLVDVYETEDRLSLVMECMEGGELFDRVSKLKMFSEKDAAKATWQMLLAVNYIHSRGVVHRDLKLENFLYESKESDHLKLIDFGFSKVWEKNTKMELSCGTLSYVAPEVLAKSYTSQCDLWSLGVVVFVLLVGYMPFGGSAERNQIHNIKHGKYNYRKERWGKVSDSAYDFVKRLLVVNPEVRLTAEKALAHPWLAIRSTSPKEIVDTAIVDSLVRFAQASQFRRSCLQMMAWSLTIPERAEVRDAFIAMDKSNTGTITLVDLKEILKERFDLEDAEAQQVFEALDSNQDDEVNYSEFLAAMMTSRIALHDDLLKATFRRFDTDNSGFISRNDLRQILGPSFQESHANSIIDKISKNADGNIDYEEFMVYLRTEDVQEEELQAAHCMIDQELERHRTSTQLVGKVRLRKRDVVYMAGRSIATCFGFNEGRSMGPVSHRAAEGANLLHGSG